jgi:hypothetical protein
MLEMLPSGAFGMGGDIVDYHTFFMGFLDTKFVMTALLNIKEGNFIASSLIALVYPGSVPPAGQEPVRPTL